MCESHKHSGSVATESMPRAAAPRPMPSDALAFADVPRLPAGHKSLEPKPRDVEPALKLVAAPTPLSPPAPPVLKAAPVPPPLAPVVAAPVVAAKVVTPPPVVVAKPVPAFEAKPPPAVEAKVSPADRLTALRTLLPQLVGEEDAHQSPREAKNAWQGEVLGKLHKLLFGTDLNPALLSGMLKGGAITKVRNELLKVFGTKPMPYPKFLG